MFLLLFPLLLVWLSCKPNPKNAITTDAISPIDSLSNLLVETNNDLHELPSTYPKVWLTTIVENAILRDTPNIKTAPQGSLTKGQHILWTGTETYFKESILIRGKSKPFSWLQVTGMYDEKVNPKWIYGGCVVPIIFDFNLLSDSVSGSTKRWLVLEKTDSAIFLQARKKAGADTLRYVSIPEKDSTPTVITVKGQEKIMRDDICICDIYRDYSLLSEADGWYVIKGSYWEWADYLFIRAVDGKEYRSKGYSKQCAPLASPSRRFWAFPSEQGYGSTFSAGGLEIFDSQNLRSFGLQLLHDNRGSGSVVDIVWRTDKIIYFKTYDQAYHKVELKDIFE